VVTFYHFKINGGKTTKCHPAVKFPEGWHVTHTPNNWCIKDTMVEYITTVIVPYMDEKRRLLGLDLIQRADNRKGFEVACS